MNRAAPINEFIVSENLVLFEKWLAGNIRIAIPDYDISRTIVYQAERLGMSLVSKNYDEHGIQNPIFHFRDPNDGDPRKIEQFALIALCNVELMY